MGQKFTYTQSVFSYISYKWFNLGKSIQVVFHKLTTISWLNFGPFLLTELVPVIGSRELEGKAWEELSLGVTSEIYLLERVLWMGTAMVTSELR